MKKLLSIITALAACASLTACSGTPKGSEEKPVAFEGIELARTGMVDRVVPDDLEDLEKYSDVAVVGEVIGDMVSDNSYMYSAYFGKEILTFPRSYTTIKVKQVLMGDVNIGDELSIEQLCGIDDGVLYSISDLTPLVKGDEWVFFLCGGRESNVYGCVADCDSRYPTKNSAAKNSRMSFAPEYQLGVYDEKNFNEKVYNEIVEKYDV